MICADECGAISLFATFAFLFIVSTVSGLALYLEHVRWGANDAEQNLRLLYATETAALEKAEELAPRLAAEEDIGTQTDELTKDGFHLQRWACVMDGQETLLNAKAGDRGLMVMVLASIEADNAEKTPLPRMRRIACFRIENHDLFFDHWES